MVGRDGVHGWVGAEVDVALNRHFSAREESQRLRIFPVLLEGSGPRPLLLDQIQSIHWSPTEPVPNSLLQSVAAGMAGIGNLDVAIPIDRCPFLGLNAFQRADSHLFFGRRKETLEALAGFGDQQQANPESLDGGGANYCRWLQIEGNSGTGKSSLVNAGMLPMIEQGALWARTGLERWRILGPMMPGGRPTDRLAEVLEQELITEPVRRDSLNRLKQLQGDTRALAFGLRDYQDKGTAFLLIIDQFEELFTVSDDKQRKQLDALLVYALQDPDCPLFLLNVVRADFLDRVEQLPRLQEIYNRHCKRYFLAAISEHALIDVIEQPARLAGLEARDVTAVIINDARDEIGALPLVENALFILWQHREIAPTRLSAQRYLDEGGLAGMLRSQADSLLERINDTVPSGRKAALELLFRLTRVNHEGRHTRQRITRDEAVFATGCANKADGEKVVQLLSGERPLEWPSDQNKGALRLITISVEHESQYVDIIHETLIRVRGRDEKSGKRIGYWPTLYDYVEQNKDRDLRRQQLKFHVERWLQSKALGRLWNLAYFDYFSFRALPVHKGTPEYRYLFSSRFAVGALMLIVALAAGFAGESYFWARKHDLPLESMLMRQRYRLGYAPLPTLVGIPAGSFDIGERDAGFLKNLPKKSLSLFGSPIKREPVANGFRLGTYEVTYEQYDYYVWEQEHAGKSALTYPTTAKGGRGTRPVAYVSWREANGYAKWFGERIRQDCRLPTEAEWEYAARAGTQTAYWWGDNIGNNKANCFGCESKSNGESSPVGSFPANPFGLYDMLGNVWEWTCSAWDENFSNNNESKCAAEGTSEQQRVIRGGSWYLVQNDVRSSSRRGLLWNEHRQNVGFRILCTPRKE